MEGGLRDITSERRLGLIFDTQVRQANEYGDYRQSMDPDVLNEFPAARFIRVQEVKQERDSHRKFEDQVYLKTDPIWAAVINEDFKVPFGPWAWGCGHDREDVDRDEAEELGLIKPGQRLEPDTKHFNENLRASTAGLDPDLLAKLQGEFGDQLVIEGEEMRWRSPNEPVRPLPAGPPVPEPILPKPAGPEPIEPKVAPLPPVKPLPEPLPGTLPSRPSLPEPIEPKPAAPSLNVNPVSNALDIKVAGGLKESVQTALGAIDQVHDDGVLPKIKVGGKAGTSNGVFMSIIRDGRMVASSIEVNSKGQWPALSAAHEVGHFLDLEAIGSKGAFATTAKDGLMQGVLDAIKKSDAVKGLESRLANTTTARGRQYVRYLLSDEELWARAYAQFIARRSGNKTLLSQLEKALEVETHRQWKEEDFLQVEEAIVEMFGKLGWMKR